MRNSFIKNFMLVAALGAVVSLAQAQPEELPEKCAPPAVRAEAEAKPPTRVVPTETPSVSPESVPAPAEKKVAQRKRCREMNDHEMDGQNAGITGSYDITGNGNMNLMDNSVQSISLSDQAQQNMSSLVNILSINSTISVMLNLNVNINSTVGTVNQGNTGTQTGPP